MTETANEHKAIKSLELCTGARRQIMEQLSGVIVGQDEVMEQLLIALFTRGHVLLEGVPGLAKTLMISSLAKTLALKFSRVQFTPDLMPADITGIDVIEEDRTSGRRAYRFLEGPVFANMVLADEINRTPPKTQSALLEAMQEQAVTVGGTRHVLPDPFFVLATQNPLEQEGTYVLPEAQQDRFMFKVFVDYPSFAEELNIARKAKERSKAEPIAVLHADELRSIREVISQIPVGDSLLEYIVRLVRGTRPNVPGHSAKLRGMLRFGAGPRGVEYLVSACQAHAALHERCYATSADVLAVIHPVLRHRLGLNFLAESEGKTADDVINILIETTPLPQEVSSGDERFKKILST
ncbi:MAG: AAA family ATPase [Thermoguttaceae bacterium]|nr:AAA family ATPase [Thermoguttaceae bacterium]